MPTVRGFAELDALPVLGASGMATTHAVAHLTAPGSIQVTGTINRLTAAATLTAKAHLRIPAGSHMSASATLGARGVVPTLSAAPAVTAAAKVTEVASAHLLAPASMTTVAGSAIAHLAAAPKLLAPGQMGAALLVGGALLSAAATTARPGAAALTANAILGSPGVQILDEASVPLLDQAGVGLRDEAAAGPGIVALVTKLASVHLTAATAFTAAAKVTHPASAHLTAATALTVTASSSAAHMTAAATLAVQASAVRLASATLTAYPVLYTPGHYPLQDEAGNPLQDEAGNYLADESGEGIVCFTNSPAFANLSSSSVLTATAFRVQHASAALSASARLTVTGTRALPGTAHLSAPGSLQATGRRTVLGVAHLSAGAVLTARGTDSAVAHLSASPTVTAVARVGRSAKAAMSANARLTATAHDTSLPTAALAAAPSLAAVSIDDVIARALLSAQAILAALADTRQHPPLPQPPPRLQPTWQRDVQHFAIAQERQRHSQALWQYGELVMFCLLWRPKDIDAGLAQRCTRCYVPAAVIAVNPPQLDSGASAEAQISAAYGQGNQYRCSLCFGTQIIAAQPAEVPGVRALLVRPAILTDTDQNQQRTAKGVVNPGTVNIQAPPDFRAHTLDYLFRSDGRRYQLAAPQRTTVRTGFATPWQQTAAIDYNLMRASLEDPQASVAYTIPPSQDALAQALGTYTRIPVSYAWIEQINGPLIPEETPPPAASGSYQPPITLGSPVP